MKLRLLECLRCPGCRERLVLIDPVVTRPQRAYPYVLSDCGGLCPGQEFASGARDCEACTAIEVMGGTLICRSCNLRYEIVSGVPRMLAPSDRELNRKTAQTGSSFGFLWGQSGPAPASPTEERLHWRKLAVALGLPPLSGLVLDAGCGEGVDLEEEGQRTNVEIVGVDLSDGGCRASFAKAVRFPNVHVVQADLARLPFGDGQFAQVYSYGVLHHMVDPQQGMNELGRVAASDSGVAVYLYEDFVERSRAMWWLLRLVNQLRRVTTRLPHHVLYRLCQAASPVVFLLLTLPHRALRRIPPLRQAASAIPFRHGTGPFSLTGDLFDRFSAPLEYRYTASAARTLMEKARVRVSRIANGRGWMVAGVRESRAWTPRPGLAPAERHDRH